MSTHLRTMRRVYGLIGQITAVSGRRDELAALLSGMAAAMPGCISYVVAEDTADPDALWVTELWIDEVHHAASLDLPEVRAAISTGRPLIAGFGLRVETNPLSGFDGVSEGQGG